MVQQPPAARTMREADEDAGLFRGTEKIRDLLKAPRELPESRLNEMPKLRDGREPNRFPPQSDRTRRLLRAHPTMPPGAILAHCIAALWANPICKMIVIPEGYK
jgi:hypothetical protein